MGTSELSASRTVARMVLIIVAVLVSLYLIYVVRKPLGWLFIAAFLAVALTGPVNFLQRRGMKRGFAITLVYLGLTAVPVALGALIVPPLVNEASNLAKEAPGMPRT